MKIENYDVHFNAIRKALSHGNAAVMVGAGFSKNAQNGDQLATWAEISSELWSELNPDERPPSAFSTSVVTQLGEQYARVFSKPALEEVLKRLIPDERVHPGSLHTQLLELPWVEIFTTNYDTLLERAADGIVGRAHYTVTCREDIPQSKILNRRRIVKLHGSFPSQRPFIFTEDEYRRYPADFAPFVNLVRQSLLENVFCLIGFSGDDPNFLHWIGWVRDMLDQHALPIYLLLDKAPSLGQQKLLDARQVTPIVLPLPPGIEPDNYLARLEAFFKTIDPSQDPEDREWASTVVLHRSSKIPKDIAERRTEIIAAYEAIASLRKNYPGWLIAPASVRQRLKQTIGYSPAFSDREALTSVLQDDAYVASVMLAEYAWYQDVVLQSMDDQLATEAKKILFASANANAKIVKDLASLLGNFNIGSLRQYRLRWKALALALLRWAREGLRRETFGEVQQLLATAGMDAQTFDDVAYQRVLFELYEGDRTAALRLLNEWEVRGADGYMLVRKGSLLTELGEIDRGISISVSGLQQLRRDQRSRSDTVRYLSEEAWACTVIHRQQFAMSTAFRRGKESQDGAQIAAQLSRRLVDLAAKGADVRRELDLLDAALKAEASIPSDPISVVPAFDLGTYSSTTTWGAPQSFTNKLNAAFEWLTLADRVSLVPRIANTNFSVNSFLCAGWWVQYADSMQRVLSVLIRTMSVSALGNRQPSDPLHAAGWMSRFQVGKTDESIAMRICETSLSLMDRILGGDLHNDAEKTLSFHVQVFGRLVLRISDTDRVGSYANRIVSMHQRQELVKYPNLWQHFATALAHCFEAIPPRKQRELLPYIWEIASKAVIAPDHFLQSWVPLHLFSPRSPLPELDAGALHFIDITEQLKTLEKYNSKENQYQSVTQRIWQYLYLLDSWSLIAESDKQKICRQLWGHSHVWPGLIGFYPEAAYAWGKPDGVDHHKAFRDWILERLIPDFPLNGSMISTPKDGRRAWGFPVDNSALKALCRSIDEETWPLTDALAAMSKIKLWWVNDWPDICHDLSLVDELKGSLLDRLDYVDIFLASIASDKSLVHLLSEEEFKVWIEEMLIASSKYGANFKRFRIAQSFSSEDAGALWAIAQELVEELGDPNILIASRSASKIVSYWLNSPAWSSPAFKFLVSCVASFIAARRMPALPWILQIATNVIHLRPALIDSQTLELVEIGLSKMQQELLYAARKDGSGIPDDNVPELRFHCANLASAMIEHLQRTTAVTAAWIAAAVSDPLPEMRFLALRQSSRSIEH